MPEMEHISMLVPKRLKEAMKDIAEREATTLTHEVRHAIKEYVASYRSSQESEDDPKLVFHGDEYED